MYYIDYSGVYGVVALLAEGVDRNIFLVAQRTGFHASPSSRRAWIEISLVTR